ncbi:DMT family transporter [Roseibium sp. RKSG952]|uniref:DMT family transporter n=1 Tax=Roseibium sp. RKSG952 TaxID=2529384 RepID=UPI0012BC5975|nr:DMT family transporter [Roseibium sp. RKSG952]MTH97785.1 DMT family transporter [Roseibium sp. RKSG952]
MARLGALFRYPPAPAPTGLVRNAPLIGITFKLGSTLAFAFMVAALKIAAESLPVGQIVFARNFFGMFPVLLMVAMRGELHLALQTPRPWGHVGRAVVGVTAMAFSFTAFALLPLPDATAIGFAAPLIVVVLAWAFLGEAVRIYRWSAVIIGFLGILVILSPHLGQGDVGGIEAIGAVCGFFGAAFAALAMIFVRKLCETERTSTIVTWFSGAATLLALVTIPIGMVWPSQAWTVPNLTQALLLVFVGLSGGIGQILLTQGYRYADASTIAPFDYVNMIWAILLGWFLFAEQPVWQVLAGSAIVVASGIFVIYREHRLGFDRTKDRRAYTPSKS